MQEIGELAVPWRYGKTLPVAKRAHLLLVAWVFAGPLFGRGAPAPSLGEGASATDPAATSTVAVAPEPPSLMAPIEAFALDARAGAIDFRTLDVPPGAGQVAMVATMEKTFMNEKARPSLTARLGSEDTTMQRVVSLKMVGGPLDALSATTFEVRNGGVDEKRDGLGRGISVGQKFDLTFAWAAGRLEIRIEGVPRYRGELDFVPVFFHVQIQSGRVAVESIKFEKARFVGGAPSAPRRKKK